MIVALCPGGKETGGPEALHQFVSMANEVSPGGAFICYAPFDESHEVPSEYLKYENPVIQRRDIPEGAFVIIPEIWTHLLPEFTQPCAIWWLSVDRFFVWSGRMEVARKAIAHFAQSDYAYRRLHDEYGLSSTMLTDYVSESFLTPDADTSVDPLRVAVSPPVGGRREKWARRRAIQRIKHEFKQADVVELGGMSRDRLKSELSSAAVFVDLGRHPGKGRLPREAALLNAVVLMARRGSATNGNDTPIDDRYKFDGLDELFPKLQAVLSNLAEHRDSQDGYRVKIRAERELFKAEVLQVVEFANSLAAAGPNFGGPNSGELGLDRAT